MESVSAFVPILTNVKNKNTEFFLKRFKNLNNSNPTDSDYEIAKKKKTKLQFVLLSLVVFGIEICYAAETAFVSPILQKIGVPLQYMSMVWGLSPLIGFFACPILGSLSDSCRSKLGRRRPFIIIYSFGIFAGLLLLGHGHYFGNLFSSKLSENPYVILFTIIGVVLLDFNCDACQSPARAYLIDVSHVSDHSIGLSTFTIMAGAGGALGYILGGIPWTQLSSSNLKESYSTLENTIFTNSSNYSIINAFYYPNTANDHKQFLFSLVAIIYAICTLFSISSFKEIPLDNLKDEGGSKIKYEKMEDDYDDFDTNSNLKSNNFSTDNLTNNQEQLKCQTKNKYFESIFKMPSSLKWLCLTHCFCWMSLLCFSLYFTDFVGEEIFGGDATENANYDDHEKYNQGVRMGSFCMAIYSISCSIYSFFLQVLMNRFRTKNVYMFSQMVYCVGMLVLAMTKSIIIAPLASVTAGIMYSSLFTIPFILVASYHSSENFELLNRDSNPNEIKPEVIDAENGTILKSETKRGLGTDLSIVSSMVFVAQFTLSFFIGTFIKLVGSKTVVVYAASLFSFCAALSSTKLFYLD